VNAATTRTIFPLPLQGWVGLLLLGVCWPLNWLLPGMRTAYLFFPLWLGYILAVDGLVFLRSGTSLLRRAPLDFVLLFLASAPTWWLFESINSRTHNWEYLGDESLTRFEYYLLCTLSFSTVMPAVFETAELVSGFRWAKRFLVGPVLPAGRQICAAAFLVGLAMLTLVLVWPRIFYPLVWVSIFLILEPINTWRGKRNLLVDLQRGDWLPVVCLSLGSVTCGFFWEMWNYYSYPKWIYHTPGAEFLRIFEMPLLGYLGYIPFAWELFALRNLIWPRNQQFRV